MTATLRDSRSRTHVSLDYHLLAFLIACGLAFVTPKASACPFCTAVAPSLAQERDSDDIVALAEVVDISGKPYRFNLHRVIKGAEDLTDPKTLSANLSIAVKQGSLVILFGNRQESTIDWTAVEVNEASAAYFVHAPPLRELEADRLEYFAPFLEHADSTIAEDAYREFGRAHLDAVKKVVDRIPNDRVREWLTSPAVPESRKGFYGLLLGLAREERDRTANAELLKSLILADADDFRSGFDGLLGGYLLLTGADGLTLLEQRYFANPKAAVGDVRHAMTALRFFQEYGREIPPEKLAAALAQVLVRPEFAQAAITDLARWQRWEFVDRIADLYDASTSTSEIRRAIIGYLRACPNAPAETRLTQLRAKDPTGVTAAEEVLTKLGTLPQ